MANNYSHLLFLFFMCIINTINYKNMAINIYCDESNHLEGSEIPWMVLGATYCPTEKVLSINKRLREIKIKHKISPFLEIKWTKITNAKIDFYLDIVDYFFDDDDLSFRGVVINKNNLEHHKFDQTHDDFYYKMYFTLLNKIINPKDRYFIYLDIKDTNSSKKAEKLKEVLCNSKYDFDKKVIQNIQHIRSHEVGVLQIADLFIGALQFLNRINDDTLKSEAKNKIIKRISERSGYSLKLSTLVKEEKFNLFYWQGSEKHNE